MSFDATTGGASANSYASLAAADQYLLEERVGSSAWLEASPGSKEAALVQATRMLDRETFRGSKATSSQALKFPRTGILDEDGNEYSSATIPAGVQRAACELALALIEDPAQFTADGLGGFSSIQLDSQTKFEMRRSLVGELPAEAFRYLDDFILSTSSAIVRS